MFGFHAYIYLDTDIFDRFAFAQMGYGPGVALYTVFGAFAG